MVIFFSFNKCYYFTNYFSFYGILKIMSYTDEDISKGEANENQWKHSISGLNDHYDFRFDIMGC